MAPRASLLEVRALVAFVLCVCSELTTCAGNFVCIADKSVARQVAQTLHVSLTLQTAALPNGVERIWTSEDHCGNVATAVQTVTATSTTCKKEEEGEL